MRNREVNEVEVISRKGTRVNRKRTIKRGTAEWLGCKPKDLAWIEGELHRLRRDGTASPVRHPKYPRYVLRTYPAEV